MRGGARLYSRYDGGGGKAVHVGFPVFATIGRGINRRRIESGLILWEYDSRFYTNVLQ